MQIHKAYLTVFWLVMGVTYSCRHEAPKVRGEISPLTVVAKVALQKQGWTVSDATELYLKVLEFA